MMWGACCKTVHYSKTDQWDEGQLQLPVPVPINSITTVFGFDDLEPISVFKYRLRIA